MARIEELPWACTKRIKTSRSIYTTQTDLFLTKINGFFMYNWSKESIKT